MAKKNKKKKKQAQEPALAPAGNERPRKLSRKVFEKELTRLQTELVHLQDWVQQEKQKVIVVFEGRDAAGKGGVIKRITERTSPRVFRVVALPAPSDRQKTQIHAQRYIEHFPAGGEIMICDRSWYNRAGVDHVMGFCSDEEYERFLRTVPLFERHLVEEGVILVKYFFDVSKEVQEERFKRRIDDPMRHWKLSPMDVKSWQHWHDYTLAYQRMLEETDIEEAPWYRVPANCKRSARLNCIAHLLSVIPYERVPWQPPDVKGLKRHKRKPGTPDELAFQHTVPQVY